VIILVRSIDAIIMSKRKVRTWDETYSDFGFTVTVVDGVENLSGFFAAKCSPIPV